MVCNKCPRKCNIDRSKNVGVCGVGDLPRVAKAYLHQWEEPIITGKNGSGTIFFSGCNLKCVYCQNYKISHDNYGKYITHAKLAEVFKNLEEKGASNINLVSPSHYVNAIIEAFKIYKFLCFDAPVLFARSVGELKFRNNTIKPTFDYEPFLWQKSAIYLNGCRQVEITGNKIKKNFHSHKIELHNMRTSDITTHKKDGWIIE